MKVRVNGGTDVWMQSFSGTGAWTQWKERSIVLPLRKGINAVVNLLPFVLGLISLIPMFFYKLTPNKVEEIRTDLENGRHAYNA